jgi:plastocyanin
MLAICLLIPQFAASQMADVSVRVTPTDAAGKLRPLSPDDPIVVWLSPVGTQAPAETPRKSFRMVQKDKRFSPHLLVVPAGSEVSFPNLDPFFHNVFSLFNGQRFDLGLYETGSRRSVAFNREGVSYIFCNIHPEMGAVIIALATPYFAEGHGGSVILTHVPPGTYTLHLWIEDAVPLSLAESARTIAVKAGETNEIALRVAIQAKPSPSHTNKYGEPYPPASAAPY